MSRIVLLCLLLPALALAGNESPVQALAQLPPLPKAAAQDLDCSLGETLQNKVQEIALRETTAGQAAAQGPMVMLSDAQMTAVQAMTDPAFNTCPIEVMQQAQDWATSADEKLAARLAQVDEARAKEDEAWCKTQAAIACEPSPAAARRAIADATAAGTQFLKDSQPGYARYVKQIGDCVAMRDKSVVAAGIVKGPFRMVVGGAHAQNWAMVGLAAEAHSKACTTAREAAQRYAGYLK